MTVNVTAVNDAPIVVADAILSITGTATATSVNVLANDTDPDGDLLAITLFDTLSANGATVTYNGNGRFNYTPTTGFIGSDTFGYTVSDGFGGTALATMTVNVTAISASCSGTAAPTVTGNGIQVSPLAAVSVTYTSVTTAGDTCASTSAVVPGSPPQGYEWGTPPKSFSVSASTGFSGPLQFCINYDPTRFKRENGLRLMQFQGTAWQTITQSLNTQTNIICGSSNGFGVLAIAEEQPTAITLKSFTASRTEGLVTIRWTTSSETDNWGFRVLRSHHPEGPFVALGRTLIPARGAPGLTIEYRLLDDSAQADKNYYYRLQDVDTRGLIQQHAVIALLTDGEDVVADQPAVATTSVTPGRRQATAGQLSATSLSTAATETTAALLIMPDDHSKAEKPAANAGKRRLPDSHPESLAAVSQTAGLSGRQPLVRTQSGATTLTMAGFMQQQSARERVPTWPTAPSTEHYLANTGFEVDISDQSGNHIKVRQRSERPQKIITSTLQQQKLDGVYHLGWVATNPQVRGFMVYRYPVDSNGKQLARSARILGFVPNFAEGNDKVYEYSFSDYSAARQTDYQYQLRTVYWDQAALVVEDAQSGKRH